MWREMRTRLTRDSPATHQRRSGNEAAPKPRPTLTQKHPPETRGRYLLQSSIRFQACLAQCTFVTNKGKKDFAETLIDSVDKQSDKQVGEQANEQSEQQSSTQNNKQSDKEREQEPVNRGESICLLYTSDAADDTASV